MKNETQIKAALGVITDVMVTNCFVVDDASMKFGSESVKASWAHPLGHWFDIEFTFHDTGTMLTFSVNDDASVFAMECLDHPESTDKATKIINEKIDRHTCKS